MSLHTLVDGLSFPEAPRWFAGRLWFSDFYTHRVLSADVDGAVRVEASVPNRPSGLGFAPDGELLVVSMLDHLVLGFLGGRSRVVADMSAYGRGPSNDMLVLPGGRAYVGNFGYDKNHGEAMRTTCLVKVESDGSVGSVADGLLFPNGMVAVDGGSTLIVAETFAERLTSFRILEDGTLCDRAIFASLPGHHPDGICVDCAGGVWVADAFGNRVSRVLHGTIAQSIPTGARGAYACALGGKERRTLFVCTNTGAGPAMADKREGRIECIEVDVPGA